MIIKAGKEVIQTVGIVTEYNPFHNGHLYQIQKIREIIPNSTIVCVMSGSLVQRGELSLLSKYDRAEIAVKCGADVVLELPSVFSLASANIFASSAVYILEKTGGVDFLCFGSECGDLQRLEKVAARLNSDEFNIKLKNNIKDRANTSFPANTAATYEELFNGDDIDIFNGSNNILGLEYLKALQNLKSNIKPVTIKRIGNSHNLREIISGESASATAIREFILRTENAANIMALQNLLPPQSYEILADCINSGKYADIKNIETAIISHIRRLDVCEIRRYAEIFHGDEYRIKKIAENVFKYDDFVENLKAKHYTTSGVRRMILNVFFGITKEEQRENPQFTTLLAFNKSRGQNFLNDIKKKSQIQIITKPASIKNFQDEKFIKAFEKNLFIDNIYKLAFYDSSGEENAAKQSPYIHIH